MSIEILKSVPDSSKAGWNVGVEHDSEGKVTKVSANQGRMHVDVDYGQGPQGYDQWGIREPNGGGSVTIPYLVIDGELYVGAISQFRPFTGRKITEASRGFSLPIETHEEAAKREFDEETGANESLTSRIHPLEGRPVNPNNTFFIANPSKNEGSKIFGLPIKPEEVELRRTSKDPKRRVYRLAPELQGEIKELNEKINPAGIRFFHESLLGNTSEGFTQIALGKISRALRK